MSWYKKKNREFYLEGSVYELIINEETVHCNKLNEDYEETIKTVDFAHLFLELNLF